MNFCKNCGAKIVPGTKFCSKCGTPVSVPVNQTPSSTYGSNPANQTPSSAYVSNPKSASYREPVQNYTPVGAEMNDGSEAFYPEMIDFSNKNKKKKRTQKNRISKKKFFGILIPVLALLIVGVVLFLKLKPNYPTVDVSTCMEIEFEGYVDDGQVKDSYPCLNMEKLQKEIDKTGIEKENMNVSAQDFGEIQLLKDDKPTDGKHLKEGEILTLTLNCDTDDLFDKTGIRFSNTTKDVKVSLIPLNGIDVFEDYTPQISGLSPAGHIRTDLSLYGDSASSFVSGCYQKYGTLPFDYYLNNIQVTDTVWLAVDDVIEVRLNENGIAYLKDQGAEANEEKKSYTLTLPMFERGAWVTDPDKISAEAEEDLASRMKGSAESYAAQRGYTDNVQFVGRAYCALKSGIDLDNSEPAQYFVYKVKKTYINENTEDEFDYIFVSHSAIVEVVENQGAEDAVENPGEIVQSFNSHEDSFDCESFSTVDDLKARFTEWNNRVDYTMDSALKTLLKWTN